jgi:hypothetical protein
VNNEFVSRRFALPQAGEVIVRFAQPVADANDFRCDYQIAWPDRTRTSHAVGVDSVQAPLLAMEKAHVDLLASDENKNGVLQWLGSAALGLPLPRSVTAQDFT